MRLISSLDNGHLHFCDGSINVKMYIEILELHVVLKTLLSISSLDCVAGLFQTISLGFFVYATLNLKKKINKKSQHDGKNLQFPFAKEIGMNISHIIVTN